MKSLILSCTDLTTLSIDDTNKSVGDLCAKAIEKKVAAVCVYPTFVEIAKEKLASSNIKVASVAGCFPAAQSPLHIKVAEVKYALEKGADEIDMVLSVGKLLEGNIDYVLSEIKAIKEACGNKTLKCILETGALKSRELITLASQIAIEGGSDFIKTSTGKIAVSATLETSEPMLCAIKDHYNKHNRKIGFKAAGGISTYKTAIDYINLVRDILGNEWLTPEYFRIGASRLVDNL